MTFMGESKSLVALQFKYVWTLANGDIVEFECVDVFQPNADRTNFAELKIIYDTYPIRSAHSESNQLD